MLARLLRGWERKRHGALRGRHHDTGTEPSVVYAVGDVHGCLDLLEALEAQIAAEAEAFSGERWLVVLGDFVDRGLESAQVVDHLLSAAPNGLRRLCLMGNHEAMMLEFLRQPHANSGWLDLGGRETLLSYGVPFELLMRQRWNDRTARQVVQSYVPQEHFSFLEALPLIIETPSNLFVHAGLRPGVAIGRQRQADLLCYRDDFADTFDGFGKTIVHGHTIREAPLVTASRIAVDTGAYLTGMLSAVRLVPGCPPALLAATRRPM